MPEDAALGLVPIVVSADGASGDRPETSLQLEIVGVRILVPTGFDAAHLGRVVAALRETSS
jgi:transposase